MKALMKRISKEGFIEYIKKKRDIDDLCLNVYTASNNTIDLANYIDLMNKPLEIIEKFFFSPIELDYITWYLYENVDKKIYNSQDKSLIAELKTDDDLWDYLNSKYVVNVKMKKHKDKKKDNWNWFTWLND